MIMIFPWTVSYTKKSPFICISVTRPSNVFQILLKTNMWFRLSSNIVNQVKTNETSKIDVSLSAVHPFGRINWMLFERPIGQWNYFSLLYSYFYFPMLHKSHCILFEYLVLGSWNNCSNLLLQTWWQFQIWLFYPKFDII